MARFSKAFDLDRNKIAVDPSRFQGRQGEFSDDTVKAIVAKGRYDRNADEIQVWKDPEDGKYYVISGHSRWEAAKQLFNSGKQADLATIPVKEFQGDEDDAIDYATIESNRGSTEEGLKSDLEAYRRAISRGWNRARLIAAFKPESKLQKLKELAHLSVNSPFTQQMGTAAEKNFPYLERNARWTGILRDSLPLTNEHEQEIFNYFYKDNEAGQKLSKDQFFKLINDKVNRIDFDRDAPLNLKNRQSTSALTDPITESIRVIDRDIDKLSREAASKRLSIARGRAEGLTDAIPALEARISDINKIMLRLVEQKEQLKQASGRIERTAFDLFSDPPATAPKVADTPVDRKAQMLAEFKARLKELIDIKSEKQSRANAAWDAYLKEKEQKGDAAWLGTGAGGENWRIQNDLKAEIRQAEPEIRNLENSVAALEAGGTIIDFTDQNKVKHVFASFQGVNTNEIYFDPETILTDPRPAYIPHLNIETLNARAFAIDAMQILPDIFLISTNTYNAKGNNHFVALTLDQLVLTMDYYEQKQKAINLDSAMKSRERSIAHWYKMPIEKRMYYLKNVPYKSLNAVDKKKVSQEQFEAMTLEERAKNVAFVKLTPIKRIKNSESYWSDGKSQTMPGSFHAMYEAFIDKTAKVREEGRTRFAHPDTWKAWENIKELLKWKKIDITEQRAEFAESRKAGMETSYGKSNTDDALLANFSVLVKRQNGDRITPEYIEDFEAGLNQFQNTVGSITHFTNKSVLVLSHSDKTYMYAMKAIGVFIPQLQAIGVSKKMGADQFNDTLAHELAHYLDYSIGQMDGSRYASDNFSGSTFKIAHTFRAHMNVKQKSNYLNSTKECFARAIQQFFAIETRGIDARGVYDNAPPTDRKPYILSEAFVSADTYTAKIKPLIVAWMDEYKEFIPKGGKPETTKTQPDPEQVNDKSKRIRIAAARAKALILLLNLENETV